MPVFYNALPGDGARVFTQALLGIICWSALAVGVARSLRTPLLARAGALLVMLLGSCIQVTEWDSLPTGAGEGTVTT